MRVAVSWSKFKFNIITYIIGTYVTRYVIIIAFWFYQIKQVGT